MNIPLKKINAVELNELIANGTATEIIDVREPVEFQSEKIKGSKNIPLTALDKKTADVPKDKAVYLLCRSGSRACQAAEKLAALGYEKIRVIEGGLEECKRQGVPVETGNCQVWALERQVRFAAGALVLTGCVLSWMLHPAFIAVSVFVGAGLVFSGLTNTCGMGMLLAKMPWNQVSQKSCSMKQ